MQSGDPWKVAFSGIRQKLWGIIWRLKHQVMTAAVHPQLPSEDLIATMRWPNLEHQGELVGYLLQQRDVQALK